MARSDCATCHTPLHPDQDWCLACGAARPDRLGARSARDGLRVALSVLGATLVLVGGASAASYAALAGDAARQAATPAPGGGDPIVAQAPATPAPPAETIVPEVAPPPGLTPAPPVAPVAPPASAGAPPASAPDGGGSGGSGGGGSGGGADEEDEADDEPDPRPSGPRRIALSAGDAQTFDTGSCRGARGAGNVVDGSRGTNWSARAAEASGRVECGIVLSLDAARRLSRLELDAESGGLTIQVRASANASPPATLGGWQRVGSGTDQDEFALDGRYRHVLVYVTESLSGDDAIISEVRLFG